jgi:hypothetical protein
MRHAYHLLDHASFYGVFASLITLFLWVNAGAHEGDLAGPRTHQQIEAEITKIKSGVMFLKPKNVEHPLRQRVISMNKAERMGLHEAEVGDEVVLTIDEGGQVLDVHKKGLPPAGHRVLIGKLGYVDPFWEVLEVSTTDGIATFAIDPMAGSKLSVLNEGSKVRVELDEDNIVIDIHPYH